MSALQPSDRIDEWRARAERAERLLAAGQAITSELDLGNVLQRILEAARELTGARYAALGVLDDRRQELSDFITLGLDTEERAAIGDPPRGHGILGLLIEHPSPLRLQDVSQHPRSYGFPLGHPPMKSFLGAPILIRDAAWGNIYLTDKLSGDDFDDHDIEAIVMLAKWAAVAIDNARLFGEATERRRALEHALQTTQTTMEITAAIGSETDLDRILLLVVKRARALVDADSFLIWLRRGDDLELVASAGSAEVPLSTRLPLATSSTGQAVISGKSRLIENVEELAVPPAVWGIDEVTSVLIVPLVHRNQHLGALVALDRLGATARFDDADRKALEAFAMSAATAVAMGRSVEEQRLQNTLAAAESERRRWARELHDETLQGMAALKLALAAALRSPSDDGRSVLEQAVAQLDADIAGLRGIITDLRPAALDELGLEPALAALAHGTAERGGLEAEVAIDLGDTRLSPELETTAYRVAQEALTNVLKHAGAKRVRVEAERTGGKLRLRVADDGRGVSDTGTGGFGLIGMRERAMLAHGTVTVDPRPDGGTVVELELPV